jgi:hydroxyacylglutathione hydrolase
MGVFALRVMMHMKSFVWVAPVGLDSRWKSGYLRPLSHKCYQESQMGSQHAPVKFQSATANPDLPGVHDIDVQELNQKRSEVCIIDVRRPDEFSGELGHIPEARLIVLDTLPDRIAELPKDQTIVFVCRSGGRSARATAFALTEGFENVYNMKGGMLRWNELKMEVNLE